MLAKSGTITQPAGTGNQAYTGVGFTPKLLLIFASDQTAAGTAADATMVLGAVAAADAGGIAASSEDAAASSAAQRRTNLPTGSGRVVMIKHDASTLAQIDDVSFDSDGFSLNWIATDGTARRWHYLALGGPIQAKLGYITKSISAAPVDQSVTGVGFRPDLIFLFTTGQTSAPSTQPHASLAVGFGKVGSEAAVTYSADNLVTTSDTRGQLDALGMVKVDESTDAIDFAGTFKSMDADGFTVTWSTNDASAKFVPYLAVEGLRVEVLTGDSPNGGSPPVAQSLTGSGFKPKAAIFITESKVASSPGPSVHASLGFGVAVSASDRRFKGIFDADNLADTVAKQRDSESACLEMFDTSGAIVETADLTSFDSDGLTLSWSAVDTTQRRYAVLLLAGRHPWPDVESHVEEILPDDRPGLRDFDFEAVGPDQYMEALKETYSGEASTLYRIADDDLVRREIFKTDAASPTEPADPDPANDAAWETYTASPHTTAALTVSKISKLLVCKRNKYNLLSMNRTPRRFELDGSGNLVANSPSAPFEVSIAAAAGGTFLIEAHYNHLADGDDAADTFLVYLTTGGGTPDPTVDIPVEVPMAKREGAAHLSYTSGAVAHGVVGKVIVRTRKQGTPDVDSRNLDVYTATASTAGPAGDAGGAFFGAVAEQHD